LRLCDDLFEMSVITTRIAHEPFEIIELDVVQIVNRFFLRYDEVRGVDQSARSNTEVDNPNEDVLAGKADVGTGSVDGQALSACILEQRQS
jgi:hypothetical protein